MFNEARRRELLEPVGQGRVGGHLTEKVERLLGLAEDPASSSTLRAAHATFVQRPGGQPMDHQVQDRAIGI